MGYRRGDITKSGKIYLSSTALLEKGIVCVTLAQALRARQFGWKIVPGTVAAVATEDFVTVHVRRDRVPSNYV